jgi:hypothetical protein
MSQFETYNTLVGTVTSFEDMVGHIVTTTKVTDDEMYLYFTPTNYVKFYHDQFCCESVYIDDVCGDLNDLIGSPLLVAEEVSTERVPQLNAYEDSFTWTFYRFATAKGDVTVKWYGSSNGYYSESVYHKFYVDGGKIDEY